MMVSGGRFGSGVRCVVFTLCFLLRLMTSKKKAKRTGGAKTVILFSSRFRVFFERLIPLRKKKKSVRTLKVDFAQWLGTDDR